MIDEYEAQQYSPSTGPASPQPAVPANNIHAPATAGRPRLPPSRARSRARMRVGSTDSELGKQICNEGRSNGKVFNEACGDVRSLQLHNTPKIGPCQYCHVWRQESCLCGGARAGSTREEEEEEEDEKMSKAASSILSLAGAGCQFTFPKSPVAPRYLIDIIVGEEGTEGEDEEIILGEKIDSTELEIASSSSTAADPKGVTADANLGMNLSDGEACYPYHEASLDSLCDDRLTLSEYPSDCSNCGSGSDDEACESDTPTCAGSSTSSSDSYCRVDVPGYRTPADEKNKGNGKMTSGGSGGHGGDGDGSPSGQKRGGRDESASGRGKRVKNNPPADQQSGESDDDDSEKRFTCPFSKRNPSEHAKCRMWSATSLSRVKGHVLRVHLKPLQCPRCAKFRAGDDGQVEKHLRDTNCEKPTTFIPVDESTVQKGKDLKKGSKKTVTWQQVYMVLFNCQQHEVPSPYFTHSAAASEHDTVVGRPSQPEVVPPAQTATPSTDSQTTNNMGERLNDGDFQRFAQAWLTKALAQQLPQFIASHLPQILEDYIRATPEASCQSPPIVSAGTSFGPGTISQIRATSHQMPFSTASAIGSPSAVSQSHFLPHREFPTQPADYNPMPMYMSTPIPGAMMAMEAQLAHHPHHGDGGDDGYIESYPPENDLDMDIYLGPEMGDYVFIDTNPLR